MLDKARSKTVGRCTLDHLFGVNFKEKVDVAVVIMLIVVIAIVMSSESLS